MIWLYALAAFAGIAILTLACAWFWGRCVITDPDEKQDTALEFYAASRREI